MANTVNNRTPLLQPGQVFGRYTVERLLGHGGMGEVWLVRHNDLQAHHVLKLLLPDVADRDHTHVERFFQEAKLASNIKHLNLVEVYDIGRHEDVAADGEHRTIYYLVMDYLAGGSLKQRLKKYGRLSVEAALEVARQVASALEAIDAHQVVHRDIKPDNIMFTDTGLVKLVDLGIAKSSRPQDSQLTQAATYFGIPAYMSPEQARDSGRVDIRADIYSLGCVLFEMLTGRPPYVEEKPMSYFVRPASPEEIPDVRDFLPETPGKVARLVADMCRKNPARRVRTPKELLRRIEAAQRGNADASGRGGVFAWLRRWFAGSGKTLGEGGGIPKHADGMADPNATGFTAEPPPMSAAPTTDPPAKYATAPTLDSPVPVSAAATPSVSSAEPSATALTLDSPVPVPAAATPSVSSAEPSATALTLDSPVPMPVPDAPAPSVPRPVPVSAPVPAVVPKRRRVRLPVILAAIFMFAIVAMLAWKMMDFARRQADEEKSTGDVIDVMTAAENLVTEIKNSMKEFGKRIDDKVNRNDWEFASDKNLLELADDLQKKLKEVDQLLAAHPNENWMSSRIETDVYEIKEGLAMKTYDFWVKCRFMVENGSFEEFESLKADLDALSKKAEEKYGKDSETAMAYREFALTQAKSVAEAIFTEIDGFARILFEANDFDQVKWQKLKSLVICDWMKELIKEKERRVFLDMLNDMGKYGPLRTKYNKFMNASLPEEKDKLAREVVEEAKNCTNINDRNWQSVKDEIIQRTQDYLSQRPQDTP